MKKIVFLTFYDTICLGPRLLSSITKKMGYEPHLIIFERDTHNKPIFYGSNKEIYTYFHQGILRGSILHINPPTEKEQQLLIDLIKKINPALLCVSTRSFGLNLAEQLVNRIYRSTKNLPVIAGGWGPTMEPERFLTFCDAICFGEGEKTFADILECLNENRGFEKINNLIFKKGNSIIKNEVYPPLNASEMNKLPYPDFSVENKYLIGENTVQEGPEFYNNKIYDCFAGRGCPMSCSYCMSGRYKSLYSDYGHHCPKYRLRDVNIVIEELLQAKKRGAIHIRIKDEVFPYNKKWLKEFYPLYKEKVNLPFFGYLRPEFHKDQTIIKLRECGLVNSLVGIQSGSEYILKNIYNRNVKRSTAKKFASLLKKLGIEYSYHLITHNPFETEEHLDETLDLCYELPQGPMHVFRLVVLPKSSIEKKIIEQKPQFLPEHIYDWYSMLYCMATENQLYRALSRFIHKRRLFKKFPYVLQILFLPSLIREYFKLFLTKKVLKTTGSLTMPSKDKLKQSR